ncbi:DUF1573 domain-containing protein [Pedobacter sp. LMG 31464]|uniref:DUF1573 domain-containing protein n=1 Tax=Pedobacter planticolens TaxID=2679964 RepID=A0A923DWS7_9SPHI|nr:DUF1573 domain-containing protein [Pedobacter planticolens]MBB2145412.1 DUF1573 domain-containing protein [Pedobacter planticolens]
MKKIFAIAFVVIAFTACKQKASKTVEEKAIASTSAAAPAVLAEDAPKVKFEKEIYDFGVIKQGEKVQTSFKFTNTGKTPLIITDATATCGCTAPEYPKTPVKPGEEGVIKVTFDSTGKMGMQDKVVTITSNANPEANKLHLVGEVKEPK